VAIGPLRFQHSKKQVSGSGKCPVTLMAYWVLAKLSARKFTGDFLGTQKTPSKYNSSFYGRIFLKSNGPSHPSRSSFNIEHGPFH
jgi:hypothetical protein